MAVNRKFELQQVLDYRVELEKLRKQDFASARQALDAAEERLLQQQQQADQVAGQFVSAQQQIDNISEMQFYADFFARKRDELKEQQKRIMQLDLLLEERRTELAQATKDKKVMERLKEKQAQAFRKEQAYKEGLLLDELATRKNGQGN